MEAEAKAVEAEAEAVEAVLFFVEAEAEARKFHRFRFHIGGKKLVLLFLGEEQIERA